MGRILMVSRMRNRGSCVHTEERVVFTFLRLEPKDHIAVPFESGSC